MDYIIYDWHGCSEQLESLGFVRDVGSNFHHKVGQDIWETSKTLFNIGLNVMVKHGDELDVLFVSTNSFLAR